MRHTYFCLFLLLMLGLIINTSQAADGAPRLLTTTGPPLTQTDMVGLWSGALRVPGHTQDWSLGPKIILYRKSGTSVTVFLQNTVLFQKDGTFIATIENDLNTPILSTLQYRGSYSIEGTLLTMKFSNTAPGVAPKVETSFQYTLSRWNDEMQIDDPKGGFHSLLRPLATDWQPRKGSLFYQGPSGPMQLEMDGQLNQSYHYMENGITHCADVAANWRLMRPSGPHSDPLVRMDGVRDGANFATITLPIRAIPGLSAEFKQLQASTTVPGYFYSLQLREIADMKPLQYVWSVSFDRQSGWEIEPAFIPSPILYPSLASPDLRRLMSHLPRGTSLTYVPRWSGTGLMGTPVAPGDPEYDLKGFSQFCQSKGIQFSSDGVH